MKQKLPYSIFQNVIYATKLAWRHARLLIVLPICSAVASIATNLAQLYIAPTILSKVEQMVPLGELLGTIGLFTLVLVVCASLKTYFKEIGYVGSLRMSHEMNKVIMNKACTTSYPNELITAFRSKQTEAYKAVIGGGLFRNTRLETAIPLSVDLMMAVVGFALYLLILRDLHPLLMVLTVTVSVVSYFVGKYANDWAYQHRVEHQGIAMKKHYITDFVMDNSAAKDIRIFGMRDWLSDVWESLGAAWYALYRRREGKLFAAKVADAALTFLKNGIAYWYLISLALNDGLGVPEFLLYFSAVSGFTGWVTTILNNISALHKTSLQICAYREYMDYPEPFNIVGGKNVSKEDFNEYELRLENVSFRYEKGEEDILTHVDLTIKPGEKLAVVGLNGAGKTTLIKLLCGYLDPTEGRVLLNGQDIRAFNRRDYYTLFTAVFQDFSGFEATIAQNVAQSFGDFDRARVDDCVKRSGLWETIKHYPKGIDTMLGKLMDENGVALSGGQNQRLMLARALYKDAPILLLDEPTAALDPIAENDMYQRYNEMTAGRTSVYISHRLASTRFCDRILFLENGCIAEEGTHEQLMALGGGYCELFNVQSQYYQEGGVEHEA